MTPTRNSRRADLQRWLKPWRQPAPWLSLVLLVITATSQPPRLWFWLALLLIVLLVGWVQALKGSSPHGE
jgi:apolipoprotein N-acyltransferase